MQRIFKSWSSFLTEKTEKKEGHYIAYHCGKPDRDADFNFDSIGSGEGNLILGPGVYFATDKSIAERYCKYRDGAVVYRAEIPMEGIYNPTNGLPANLRFSILPIVKRIEEETGKDPYRGVQPLTHGKGAIGAIVKHYGIEEGREILVRAGVKGAIETLPSGIKEIALYTFDGVNVFPEEG